MLKGSGMRFQSFGGQHGDSEEVRRDLIVDSQ